MYAHSLSMKHSLVVTVVALTVLISGQRALAEPLGDLVWFTDQAAFEAFNQDQGNVPIGIEDFEESILPGNSVDAMDDPLRSGIPNLPDGFPFPQGMTGLPNLRFQSNILGGNPTVTSPRGLNGLSALSDGFLGVVSDIVLPGNNNDSFDMIFEDVTTNGIGFNTIVFGGGANVQIRVYDLFNNFQGMMTTPDLPPFYVPAAMRVWTG